jgi:hypothetical protein
LVGVVAGTPYRAYSHTCTMSVHHLLIFVHVNAKVEVRVALWTVIEVQVYFSHAEFWLDAVPEVDLCLGFGVSC